MFRHRKIAHSHPTPRRVYHTVLKQTVENGVTYSRPVRVPVDGSHIPDPSEYRLEDLIASGIPLNAVSPLVVGSTPTSDQLENIVNKVVESDKTE